ncbi:MAG TPA: 3-dehydroquinate synthase [Desulfobulbus sp.]|nr:3-dehydroquinate synthase [Desulfobulbus sp.]
MNKQQVTVGLGERSYPIVIQPGVLHLVGQDIAARKIAKRFGIISDDYVAALYGDTLLQSLADAGVGAELVTFPRGEASKNLQTIATLASELAGRGFDRGDGLIALGGGVSGDMAGFLASIYMRGIPFVQIPTTLLSQVDSSVGGKTGVDIPEGKNLVGTFYQPQAVYIDPDVLKTLPEKEILGGLAEVIKYGVIWDADFFNFLDRQRGNILALREDAVIPLIARCCEIKAQVVEQDEREGGLRRILNFGHTIGHAVEAASGFSLIHGLAIGIGMRAAADLAVLGGHLAKEEAARIRRLLEEYGLPVIIPSTLDRTAIKQFLLADKKTIGGRVFFVLPEAIGRVRVTDEVDKAHIDEVLDRA